MAHCRTSRMTGSKQAARVITEPAGKSTAQALALTHDSRNAQPSSTPPNNSAVDLRARLRACLCLLLFKRLATMPTRSTRVTRGTKEALRAATMQQNTRAKKAKHNSSAEEPLSHLSKSSAVACVWQRTSRKQGPAKDCFHCVAHHAVRRGCTNNVTCEAARCNAAAVSTVKHTPRRPGGNHVENTRALKPAAQLARRPMTMTTLANLFAQYNAEEQQPASIAEHRHNASDTRSGKSRLGQQTPANGRIAVRTRRRQRRSTWPTRRHAT